MVLLDGQSSYKAFGSSASAANQQQTLSQKDNRVCRWRGADQLKVPVVMQARIASQAVCVDDYVWLIGGWDPGMNKDGGEILSDIWRLDTKSWMWSEAHTQAGHSAKQP